MECKLQELYWNSDLNIMELRWAPRYSFQMFLSSQRIWKKILSKNNCPVSLTCSGASGACDLLSPTYIYIYIYILFITIDHRALLMVGAWIHLYVIVMLTNSLVAQVSCLPFIDVTESGAH